MRRYLNNFLCKNSKKQSSLEIDKKHIHSVAIHIYDSFLQFFFQKSGGHMPVPVSEDLEILLCKNLIFDDFQVSI